MCKTAFSCRINDFTIITDTYFFFSHYLCKFFPMWEKIPRSLFNYYFAIFINNVILEKECHIPYRLFIYENYQSSYHRRRPCHLSWSINASLLVDDCPPLKMIHNSIEISLKLLNIVGLHPDKKTWNHLLWLSIILMAMFIEIILLIILLFQPTDSLTDRINACYNFPWMLYVSVFFS